MEGGDGPTAVLPTDAGSLRAPVVAQPCQLTQSLSEKKDLITGLQCWGVEQVMSAFSAVSTQPSAPAELVSSCGTVAISE